jgi:hypothetical protein
MSKLVSIFKLFIVIFFAAFISISLSSCGGGGGSSSSNVQAPESIAGDVAKVNITYGNGYFATSGKALYYFYKNGEYDIVGDGVNVANSFGEYQYAAIGGNKAKIRAYDNYLGETETTLTFNTESSGTFVTYDVDGYKQTGSFVFQ